MWALRREQTDSEMCSTQPNSVQLGVGTAGPLWQKAFNNENPAHLGPGAGLEVVPSLLGLPPLRRPCVLSEPGETNPFNFQHSSRAQPSPTQVWDQGVLVGMKRRHPGTRISGQNSPQNSTVENQARKRGLRDIYERLAVP